MERHQRQPAWELPAGKSMLQVGIPGSRSRCRGRESTNALGTQTAIGLPCATQPSPTAPNRVV
eukprot:9897616-Alexandrium_andersonii.AAC.1